MYTIAIVKSRWFEDYLFVMSFQICRDVPIIDHAALTDITSHEY
jgi:hypothetical protein